MENVTIAGIDITVRGLVVLLLALSFLMYIWMIKRKTLSPKKREQATILVFAILAGLFLSGFFAIGIYQCNTMTCYGTAIVDNCISTNSGEVCYCRCETGDDADASCGNGVCDPGESSFGCARDCYQQDSSYCGDGTCNTGESYWGCPGDCQDQNPANWKLTNGNPCSSNTQCLSTHCVHGKCRAGTTYCGDTFCDSGETASSCAKDCESSGGDDGGVTPGDEDSDDDGVIDVQNTGCSTTKPCTPVSGYTAVCEAGVCKYSRGGVPVPTPASCGDKICNINPVMGQETSATCPFDCSPAAATCTALGGVEYNKETHDCGKEKTWSGATDAKGCCGEKPTEKTDESALWNMILLIAVLVFVLIVILVIWKMMSKSQAY